MACQNTVVRRSIFYVAKTAKCQISVAKWKRTKGNDHQTMMWTGKLRSQALTWCYSSLWCSVHQEFSPIVADRSMIEVGIPVNIRRPSIRPCDWLLGTVVLGCCCTKNDREKVTGAESNGFIRWVDAYSAVLVFWKASTFRVLTGNDPYNAWQEFINF